MCHARGPKLAHNGAYLACERATVPWKVHVQIMAWLLLFTPAMRVRRLMNGTTDARRPWARRYHPALGRLLLGLLGGVTLASAREAHACSPPPTGWNWSVAVEGSANGIPLALECFNSCTQRPDVQLTVRSEGGDVQGTLSETEFGGSMGWAVWRPTLPLTTGVSYEVSISSGDQLIQTTTYRVLDSAPTLAAASSPTFETVGFVETVGGEPCCEEAAADTCGGTPRCFPDRSSVRSRVSVQALWADAELNPMDVRLAGEFFTATDRRAAEPRVGGWLQGVLPPADEGGEYCYKITARHLITDETRLFEGCKAAENVELPDAEAQRRELNTSGITACDVPKPKYEAAFCEVHSADVDAHVCKPDVRNPGCENALSICATPEPLDASTGCSMGKGRTGNDPWGVALAVAVLGLVARRRRIVHS